MNDSVGVHSGGTGSAVPRDLRDALRRLAATPRLLVALDFDGTLAPTVDDPAKARALPEARAAVDRILTLPGTRVAFVSGRALDSLEEVSGAGDDTILVGSHGIEVRLDSPDEVFTLGEEEQARLGLLGDVLDQVADNVDDVWIETKPAGFALHTRLATERNSRIAHLVALSEAHAEVDDLTVRRGKDVLEFSVRSTTKGEAVEHLRRYTGASAVFYAGDDVTDEDAFEALGDGDLALKIGSGTTVADHRVDGPEDVAHVLSLLADLRASATDTDRSN
ncbi:trehalose-phosphatase [Herbiconiux sp. L3-i23]|uniref:trehalose-phosphatase n=1 Tax=Herbiconiux sp. L3-i23 TaxID=2905871 RepID=UPI00206A65D2|nr:trehalose-phosphatase [Herbiconiux sp. L3-i23]BDI21753.1 trehalose 6-phosphate phosphatase [Herbiconiux sp. L3-i23]